MTDLGKSSGTLRRVYGALLLVPVVALVWFDQMAAGVILACLGCLMGLEIKRITGLPLVAGLFVLALISVQSFPHWMLGLAFTMNVGLALMGFGLVAAIIAACDSAAYFVGRKIGGPKLWPRVSPNKTISGSVGGLVAAMAITSLVASVFGIDDLIDAMIMGVVIGGLSQAGDLMESAVKRRLDVKDSGAILPGHGGMLDRFDGYIFVIPAVYLYIFGF